MREDENMYYIQDNIHRMVKKIIHTYKHRQKAALKALLFSMAYTHSEALTVRK